MNLLVLGVILAPVLSPEDDMASFLVILDAGSFTEIARATLPEGVKCPMTFHGIFSKDSSQLY